MAHEQNRSTFWSRRPRHLPSRIEGDSHEHFRNAVVEEAETAHQALEVIRKRNQTLAVLDITMPGRSGLEILTELKKANSTPRCLFERAPGGTICRARVESRRRGLPDQGQSTNELVDAINKVLAGGKYITPSLAEKLAPKSPPNTSDCRTTTFPTASIRSCA